MYVLLAYTVIGDAKKNEELFFRALPTMPELKARLHEVFTLERKMRVPAGKAVFEFIPEVIKLYDEAAKRWVPLERNTQLFEYAQLYVEAAGDTTVLASDSMIPEAARLTSRMAKSPLGWKTGLSTVPSWGFDRETQAKVVAVFEAFDAGKKGYIIYDDIARVFESHGMGLSPATLYNLFHAGDADNDGRISWDEFVVFFDAHPKLMHSVYLRTRDDLRHHTPRRESSMGRLASQEQEEQALAILHDTAEKLNSLEQYVNMYRDSSTPDTSNAEAEQERRLLEQQAKLQRMANRLQMHEQQLDRQTRDFTQKHGRSPGSPSFRSPGQGTPNRSSMATSGMF
ncbi:flagellar protein essential for flagellar pocket biogenesis [Diplonema papillatum]|nr:flagellar protein essential for flagellar pocket biogenesis [Diplonema papillatum]